MNDSRQPDPDQQIAALERFRGPVRRSYWTMALSTVEPGDVLSQEHHARVYELLPEDGLTLHTIDALGKLVLLVAIPEEQLAAFDQRAWQLTSYVQDQRLTLYLLVGNEEPLGCPFDFNLSDPQDRQEALQLALLPEIRVFGFTHMEEGLMLTVQGAIELAASFHTALAEQLEAALGGGDPG